MKTLSNFEKIAKKNKQKSWVKIIVISTVISLLAVLGLVTTLEKMTSRTGVNVQKRYLKQSEIAYPNIDYTTWGYQATSPFSGTFYSHRTKDIDGIIVPFEKYEGDYFLFLSDSLNQGERLKSGDNGQSAYTYETSYKIPLFFDTAQQKQTEYKVTQDLNVVPEMTGKAVEVAVTFDKPYSLAEIAEKIPENLKLNWIWIGSYAPIYSDGDLANQFGFTPYFDASLNAKESRALEKEIDTAMKKNPDANISEIYAKYDKKVTPLEGMENSYSIFQTNVQDFLSEGYGSTSRTGEDGKEYSTDQFLKDYLVANPDPKSAKFAGVILTGRSENFAQLKDVDWIFASNIGQSVEIQPYHHLEK
ncbi:anti sigma factor C-terminal domain-containing protein [Streptococcus sp. S784/96/1]|uniref:anti sigma factor C-terminal domain-containing protein n=1 Tax=Streptococcus sp. S784/96/1 TaxID=2653499 RepID=UPI001389B3E2|nr:anti sigma factor C-terminal domain-containing protein [Streptococcus sp. S784/96/1]